MQVFLINYRLIDFKNENKAEIDAYRIQTDFPYLYLSQRLKMSHRP